MTSSDPKTPMTYRDAGVDIAAGNAFVERIKPLVKATHRAGTMGSIGGFGGLFDTKAAGFKDPVLVSGTDGVGTKLMLAQQLDQHHTIGIDLVAMCVNDVLVLGATPLFFLDYFATGKLDPKTAADVVSGIAQGCQETGCALIGGETAEMPDMYPDGKYDLAGFAVGAVERDQIIDGKQIKVGDVLLGLPSSGPHSNGYSLIRKILERSGQDPQSRFDDAQTLAHALLCPTRLYVQPVLDVLASTSVHGMAHITGGGLMENIIRVLPEEMGIQIHLDSFEQPRIFQWLQQQGNVEQTEMLTTFNCGIGYVLILPETAAANAQSVLKEQHDMDSWMIGQVREADQERVQIV